MAKPSGRLVFPVEIRFSSGSRGREYLAQEFSWAGKPSDKFVQKWTSSQILLQQTAFQLSPPYRRVWRVPTLFVVKAIKARSAGEPVLIMLVSKDVVAAGV